MSLSQKGSSVVARMNVCTDSSRVKRRRLNTHGNNEEIRPEQSQPLHTQRSLSIFRVPAAQSEPELCSDGRATASYYRLSGVVDFSRNEDLCDAPGAVQESSECCYGMLCDIPTKPDCELSPKSRNIPVNFDGPRHLFSKLDNDSTTFDILCPLSARIIGELEGLDELQTQLYCRSKPYISAENSPVRDEPRCGHPPSPWLLNIIIFGPEKLEERIGAYLSKHRMYLQDPIGCDRRVPYRNPHIIPPDSGHPLMTNVFNCSQDLEDKSLEAGPDLLAQLMEGEDPLPFTEASSLVKTRLFPHQKQALTFMIRREQGWNMEQGSHDIWSQEEDALGRSRYINNVSGAIAEQAPPGFRGGLLADDMGLGKTLSMISLIATNRLSFSVRSDMSRRHIGCISSATMKTTLLVVPRALIQSWEKQFVIHLLLRALKVHVYHGQNRTDIKFLGAYDVVITTYHTVSAIWRKRNEQVTNELSIFSLTWYRLILDEAHIRQNPQRGLAQACCALRAPRRWAITGTPIQNKLADFASIVKFLQIYPYSDLSIFEKDILRPWQNRQGANAEGFLRLKTLVRAITLRRTKSVVELPPRVDEIRYLTFTMAEKEKYEAAKSQLRARIEEAISSGSQSNRTFNALWLLNILRLICVHGLLSNSMLKGKMARQEISSGGIFTGGLASDNILNGTICSVCGETLLEKNSQDSVSRFSERSQRTGCLQMVCQFCISQMDSDTDPDRSLFIENDGGSTPETPIIYGNTTSIIESMPTKIKALVSELCKRNATEKSVVFSYWTNTLDLVQLMLKDQKILCVRIDGKTSLPRRNGALHDFQTDDSVRVILVSITCGGVGIDLTAGSRAYLLEPQWNPMIEEQALCRVHRVGQRRSVRTIRYLMRESIEEQIVDAQKRKKLLAQLTFAQGPLSEDGIGLGTLQYLKSVLG